MDDEHFKGALDRAGILGCLLGVAFFLIIGSPVIFLVGYTTGGCEAVPQPCHSNSLPFLTAIAVMFALSICIVIVAGHLLRRWFSG